LPDEVVYFLRYFKEMIEEQSVTEILGLYEHGFTELTEKFFSEKMWPEDKIVEKVVGTGYFLKGIFKSIFSFFR